MSESGDNYGRVVARLNSRWRVIECRHLIQWILQYRASAETYATSRWVGRTPGSDSYVFINDLPEGTQDEIRRRIDDDYYAKTVTNGWWAH